MNRLLTTYVLIHRKKFGHGGLGTCAQAPRRHEAWSGLDGAKPKVAVSDTCDEGGPLIVAEAQDGATRIFRVPNGYVAPDDCCFHAGVRFAVPASLPGRRLGLDQRGFLSCCVRNDRRRGRRVPDPASGLTALVG